MKKSKEVIAVEQIFRKFKKFLPKAYHNIQLGLVFTNSPNYRTTEGAYAIDNTINLGINFVRKYYKKYPGCIASVLAHELGHHVMSHFGELYSDRQSEHDADLFALYLCELAGYRREYIMECDAIFEAGRAHTIKKDHKDSHGTSEKRLEALAKQSKYLDSLEDE